MDAAQRDATLGAPPSPLPIVGSPGRAWRPALFPAPPDRPTGADRLELAGFVVVLLLAALTPTRTSGGAANAPLMETLDGAGVQLCLFKAWTGMECGGCGLTRAFVQLAHGHVLEAIRLNPMAPFAFAWTLWATAERVALVVFRRTLRHGIPNAWVWRLYSACFLGFTSLWAIRVLFALAWT